MKKLIIKVLVSSTIWTLAGLWIGMHYGQYRGYAHGVSDMADLISAILDVKEDSKKLHGPTEI